MFQKLRSCFKLKKSHTESHTVLVSNSKGTHQENIMRVLRAGSSDHAGPLQTPTAHARSQHGNSRQGVADASDQESHEIQNKETNSSRHRSKQNLARAARALSARDGTIHRVAARRHSPCSARCGAAAEETGPALTPPRSAWPHESKAPWPGLRRRRRFRQHCGRPP
jgi:hypothetical protein